METVNWISRIALTVCSGVAFGVLAMTGVVAAVVFPAMRDLDPALPQYSGYSGQHWSLAAGLIAERFFGVGFVAVGVALGVCVAAAGGLVLCRGSSRLPAARLGLLAIAAGVFLTHVAWLQPAMRGAALEYRAAAASGDEIVAREAKARFDALHPYASGLVLGASASSLALFVASSSVPSPFRSGARHERGAGARR